MYPCTRMVGWVGSFPIILYLYLFFNFFASSTMGFSRQEYWSGLPFPPPGVLPHPGIQPASLTSALGGEFFNTSVTWEAPVISTVTSTYQGFDKCLINWKCSWNGHLLDWELYRDNRKSQTMCATYYCHITTNCLLSQLS